MSNHVIEWLNAYLDGELHGHRLRQVEEHLAECEACQAELDSLQGLSSLLQEVPVAEFTPNEKFVSQVNLRLPQRQVRSMRNKAVEIGWWLIPIGLLTAWIFFSTIVLVSDMVTAADTLGLLDSQSTLLVSDTADNAYWSSTLGRFGVLEGNSLEWAESTESYTRNVLPQYIWQVSIALLYLTWIAIWWARQTHQEQVPLLEG